jgi:hypothetical protein
MACNIFRNDAGAITRVTAPNGKDSVLFQDLLKAVRDPEEAIQLWAQVYTPSFKNWFGDWEKGKGSKVVDQNGEPILVYHNSMSPGIEKFNTYVSYFTDSPEYAKTYKGGISGKNQYLAFLNLKNPYNAPSPLADVPYEVHVTDEFTAPRIVKQDVQDGYRNSNDGVIGVDAGQTLGKTYVTFEPNQVFILGSKQNVDGREQFVPSKALLGSVEKDIEDEATTEQKVLTFLAKIGVSYNAVSQVKDSNGNPIGAIAKADMLNKVIEVVEGRADASTLPEEAAHFFVNMLPEDSPLLKNMMEKITSFQIYTDTVQSYKNLREYRNADGTVNFKKIKKEAVGKAIAYHMLQQELGNETQAKMGVLAQLWRQLWDYVTNIFSQVEENPFDTAAGQILEGSLEGLGDIKPQEGIYFSMDSSINKLRNDQGRIKLDNSIDKATGQKRHVYMVDGKAVKKTVTTTKVDAYYKKIFPNDRRDERQKEVDLLKAEYGDVIHEMMEALIGSYVDPATGYIRDEQGAIDHPQADSELMRKLNDFILPMLQSYPPNTVFMTEVRVYDAVQDMAGSVDLIAVQPDGTVDIYDWKSQEIAKLQTELKDFKGPAYKIQLSEYKRILQQQYGFKKFGKVRAIPIKTIYNYKKVGTNYQLESLKDIEIGNFDSTQIEEGKNYLLPVTIDESTGDKGIDKLIKQLEGIYKKIEQRKFKASELFIQKQELARYRNAIRDLQLRGSLERFISLGNAEAGRYNKLLQEGTLSSKDVRIAREVLQVFSSTAGILKQALTDLKKVVDEMDDPQAEIGYRKLMDDYNKMNSSAAAVLVSVEDEMKDMAITIAEREGIENYDKAEKSVGGLAGWFNSLSTMASKGLKTFYLMLRGVQNKRDAQFDEMNAELQTLRTNLLDWGKKKGLAGEKLFDMMLDFKGGKWTGNFLKKYDSEFYKKRDEAIRAGDTKWLIENTRYDKEVQEAFEKEKARKLEYYKEVVLSSDPEENQKLVTAAYQRWVQTNNPRNEDGSVNLDAYLNPRNKFLKPSENWQTSSWMEINKTENKPVLDAYLYFQKLLRHSEQLGMLDDFSPEFIPSMFKTKVDQMVFGNFAGMFSGAGMFESLAVDSGSEYFPDTDPVTGEVLNRIPVFFTRDIGTEQEDGTATYEKKSRDLFKVFSIWGAHMYSYEAMQTIEDDVQLLTLVERNKESLVTNIFNEAKRDADGKLVTKPGNERNAKLLNDFANFYLYNRKGGEQYDFKINMFGKTFSAQKSFQFLLGFFSLKTLALNPLSGSAQFVGGTGNAFLLGSKKVLFNNKDWTEAMYDITRKDDKAIGLLDHFNLLLEDTKRKRSDELSVSKAAGLLTVDNMYVFQRLADKGVQYPVGVVMMKNYMVDENGKLVNITAYVKQQMGYENFYNLSKAERAEMQSKIDEEVGKLKAEKSIYATAEIVDDKMVIPGVEPGGENAEAFRAAVKKAYKIIIGNSTSDDINLIRTTALGMSLMQFRSWIPAMAKERLGELYKDEDLEMYQYGKFRSFFGELFSKRMPTMMKSLVLGFGDDAIEAAKAKYQELKAEAFEQGEEFEVTEAEFIDMHIGNQKSTMREIMIIIAFWMMLLAVKPGDDDNEDYKGLRKYMARGLAKYLQEFAFYYNPIEFTSLIKSPFPIISLAEDFYRFIGNSARQGYGFATGDEKLMDAAKPLKYLFRIAPITKEAVQMTAIFDDDFRKEWGIRIQ